MKYLCISLLALTIAAPALADAAPDDILVTATRSGDGISIRNLPLSVTLLSGDDLANRQTRVVSDVLRDVPGVAVRRSGGIGGYTQLHVRGSESNHVLVLIDGIKASDPYIGEFDFGTLIADEGARIEVLRGQQSSLYGSEAIGGVINYITPSGREASGVRARAEGGSFGSYALAMRAGGFSDHFDYALSASLYGTSGTPSARNGSRDLGSTSFGTTAKFNWTPAEIVRVKAVGRYSRVNADYNNSEQDSTDPLFGQIVDSPGTRLTNESFYGLVRAELDLAEGRSTTGVSAQLADSRRRNYSLFGFDYGSNGRRWKASFDSTYRVQSGATAQRLTGAVDFEHEEYQNLTPSPYAFGGWRSTRNWALVGEYGLEVADAFFADASVRQDFNNRFADTTTWRTQAGYRLPMGLRLRAAYGTGVKNPDFFDLFGYADGRYIGNPNLKPERSKGWEAGIDQLVGGNLATIGVTYFRATLQDEIFATYPAPAYVATPANRTTLSRQEGVEFTLSSQPVAQIRFDLAYTWLRANENGIEEARRPRHSGSFNVHYADEGGPFSATLTLRYNGRQTDLAYTDPSYVPLRVSMQEYVLVNLGAEYKLTNNFTLFARAENLFDERYEELFSYRAQGRAVFGGVRASF